MDLSDLVISVVGLGYVGMPIAVTFAEKGVRVVGFDVNQTKVQCYLNGEDPTHEIGHERLQKAFKAGNLTFTCDENDLKAANFHIVAVPTPVNDDRTPDLRPVIGASHVIGRILKKGDYVVYESTVYPGLTEETCIPILEKLSGLKYKEDWKLGYSPERINPGDKVHVFKTIVKVVSGCDAESLERVAKVYELVVEAGVYRAASIKVAEAAKVIENSQRDMNIAFMNELARMFDVMDIDTKDVLEAAGSKWNFLKFSPGLVGGHCIGVDPFYLTYRAQNLGYTSIVIQNGRYLNDHMGSWIGQKVVKMMVQSSLVVKGSRVCMMGVTFKENCPDTRNSKVHDIITELKQWGVEVVACDPLANAEDVLHEYKLPLVDINTISDCDAIIVAVSHDEYTKLSWEDFRKMYKNSGNKKVIYDVKSVLNRDTLPDDFFLKRL